eukprot:tig00000789_g4101.t1
MGPGIAPRPAPPPAHRLRAHLPDVDSPWQAYADDTVLISSSARGVQLHADLVSEFFWIHDIALNAKKTEFTYNNVSPKPKPPLLGPPGAKERAHHVLPPTKPFKFLGVWFTADLNWRHQFAAVYTMARTACAILKKKKLTAKEAVYIVNSVLIPRITYACKVVAYTERQCAQIDTLWMTLVKHQARLRRSAPNALMWSRGFYGLKRLADEQLAIHVLDETIRANHPTLRPYLLHRVFAAQEKLCLPLPHYCYPNLDPGPALRRDHLALAIARNMNAEGYILDSGRSHLTPALPHPRLERRFVLTTLLPPALLRSAAPFLWEHDLLTAADITGPDGRTVLDWASLWGSGRVRQRLSRAPSWFPDFLRAICEPVPPRKLPRSLRFPMHVLKQGARRQQTLFEANLMSPPYVEGQFAWHPQGYLTRIVSKWEERDEDDGRLHVYVRLEHWIWRDRTIRDGDGEGAARFYKCTMLKDECDARYTTDDATAKAARQRCDHSEPESGACQWTEDSIHIHPARLLELITPATRTRKHEPYAVVKLESQEWWTEFRTTLFLPPWERDWDYEADPSAQPQPPPGYQHWSSNAARPLEHFLIDPEPLADPFWNLVAQELRREELPAARPPRVAATDASTTGFGSEAALTAYAGVWTRDHEQNAAHSPADRQREAQRRSEDDDASQAAALRELAEAIPTDGSDFFVAPCPGTVNNNKGELLAVLTAFLKSPEGCTVKTDSSTAMSLICRSVLHRADSTVRSGLRTNFSHHLRAAEEVHQHRRALAAAAGRPPAEVRIQKVKAHQKEYTDRPAHVAPAERETDSDADDSGSYVSYLSAPDDLPPEPSDAELIAKFGEGQGVYAGRPNPLSGAYNYLSEHIRARTAHLRRRETRRILHQIERQTRKARREERQRRRDALAALGPHVPALAGLPIAQRMERVLNDAYDRDNHRADRLAAAALALHPCAPFSKADPAVASDPAASAAAKRAWLARSLEGYDSRRAYRVESDPRAHVRAVCEMRNFVRLTSLESSWLGAPADRARLAREFRKPGASRNASAPFNARLAQLTKFSMELAPLLPVRARDAPHLYGNINPHGLCVRPGCARVADASGGPIPAPPWAPRRDPGAAATADRDPPPALHSASQPETHDHAFGLCSASQAVRLAMQSKIYNLLHTTITTQRLKSTATRPRTNARDPGLYPPTSALFTDLSHDSPRLSVRLLLPRSLVPALEYLHDIWQARNSDVQAWQRRSRTRSADSPHSPPTNLKATSRSDAPPPSPWPPLPPSEEEVLRQISSPLLGTSGSINVTRRSLSRLNGETWLDDETVVFYLALLAHLPAPARRPLIFDSLEYPNLSAPGRGPQRLHNKLVARGVSPFDFDVLLFPIHSPGHWNFAAIHSRLERSWPQFSAGSSSSAGNATSPQTTPPPGRLHRPPDALVRGQEDVLTDPNSPFDGSSRPLRLRLHPRRRVPPTPRPPNAPPRAPPRFAYLRQADRRRQALPPD